MRWLFLIIVLVACSSPDYKFASSSSITPDASSSPSSPTDAGADVSNASVDAAVTPAPPIDPIDLAGDDIVQACAAVATAENRIFTFSDNKVCYLFFASTPFGRSWQDAKLACLNVRRRGQNGKLASIETEGEAIRIQDFFRSGQIPWIGLELLPGRDANDKGSFRWLSGSDQTYDGWATTPSGSACVAWQGDAKWADVSCDSQRGFLCEISD